MNEKMNSSRQESDEKENPWDILSEEQVEQVDEDNPLGLSPSLNRLRQKLKSMSPEERKKYDAEAAADFAKDALADDREEYMINRDLQREVDAARRLRSNELTPAEQRKLDQEKIAEDIASYSRDVMEALKRGERPN